MYSNNSLGSDISKSFFFTESLLKCKILLRLNFEMSFRKRIEYWESKMEVLFLKFRYTGYPKMTDGF